MGVIKGYTRSLDGSSHSHIVADKPRKLVRPFMCLGPCSGFRYTILILDVGD